MDATMIARVRRFNRTVTQRVGALDDKFLARERPLGQSRVVWEIGAGPVDIRALRSRLDLDSGYLSRLLRALERDGLVVVEPSPADGRVRTARLTPAGEAERAELDRRSDAAAGAMLGPLSTGQRDRLVAAMTEVERLLTASAVTIAVRDAAEADAVFCLQAYYDELGERFDDGFDPGRSLPADGADLLVASLYGSPVGCGAVLVDDDSQINVAQIKRMWVSPSARGLGLGKRLLAELEARAASAGARVLRLETNRSLTEAIGMYRSAGYQEVAAFNDERYAHHWFEKRLVF
jgi:DNA-binding MarR family transcriptional regulator